MTNTYWFINAYAYQSSRSTWNINFVSRYNSMSYSTAWLPLWRDGVYVNFAEGSSPQNHIKMSLTSGEWFPDYSARYIHILGGNSVRDTTLLEIFNTYFIQCDSNWNPL